MLLLDSAKNIIIGKDYFQLFGRKLLSALLNERSTLFRTIISKQHFVDPGFAMISGIQLD